MNRLAFSDDMMRALAAGEKSMTRRPEKRATPASDWVLDDRPGGRSTPYNNVLKHRLDGSISPLLGSHHRVGDLVAATCAYWPNDSGEKYPAADYRFQHPEWEAEFGSARIARKMSADLAPFVPRITAVRAERLGEISDEDAVREGMMHWARGRYAPAERNLLIPRDVFAAYWRKLYGPGAWERDRDRWVWCYSFAIEERRIG
jgi:hypothetical protein